MTRLQRHSHPRQTLRPSARAGGYTCVRVRGWLIGNRHLAPNLSWQYAIKIGVTKSIWIHHACATPGSTHQHSGQHHAISSGGHASVSTAKSWLVSAKEAIKLFSYNAGIKLVSAAANVDAQALSKSLHILAKLRITQTAENITFTAKEELRINGGTSFSILNASGITHGTSGQWEVKAATQALETGRSMAVSMPQMPHAEPEELSMKRTMDLFYHYPDLTGVAGASYRVVFANGEVREGKLDDHGKATLQNVPIGPAQVYYGETSKNRPPESPAFGKAISDDYILADLKKLGLNASSGQDIDQLLAQLTERPHD